jgi:CSLREA domain-containing protein
MNDELNLDADCSLREAIQAANIDAALSGCAAGSGADAITVPAGILRLRRVGANEDNNSTGDLDILQDVTIRGAGGFLTVIDGNATDRVARNSSSDTCFSAVFSSATTNTGALIGWLRRRTASLPRTSPGWSAPTISRRRLGPSVCRSLGGKRGGQERQLSNVMMKAAASMPGASTAGEQGKHEVPGGRGKA